MAKGEIPTTNAHRIHLELREAIIDGTFRPGERLRAEALATRFGSSRTPVREALLTLEREGLVQVLPNRGAMVRPFDANDVVDYFELRAVLEPRAASQAATRIDPAVLARLEELCSLAEALSGNEASVVEQQMAWNSEFHRLIFDAAGSSRLLAAMSGIGTVPNAFRTALWAADERARWLLGHREILFGLTVGRPELAEAAMRTHILAALEFLLKRIIKDTPSGDGNVKC